MRASIMGLPPAPNKSTRQSGTPGTRCRASPLRRHDRNEIVIGGGVLEVARREIPVDQLVDDRAYVVGPPVLIVKIVGVLPDIDSEQRRQAHGEWHSSVSSTSDRQGVAVRDQPCPAASELLNGGVDPLRTKLVEAAERAVNALGERAGRLASASRLHAFPVERMVPCLCCIVESTRLI